MATDRQDSGLVNITLTKGTKVYKAILSQDLYDMINDPNCDPAIKDEVYKAAISEHEEQPNSSCSNVEDSNTLEPGPEKIHIWKENEEKDLISIRSEMEDKFQDVKNHEVLWGQLTKTLNSHNVSVSINQVKNKWKNLKKTYKKVVDDNQKTGNKKTTWKYFEEFNSLYGNRASTTAKITYDSSKGTMTSPGSPQSDPSPTEVCVPSTSQSKRKSLNSKTDHSDMNSKKPKLEKKGNLSKSIEKLTSQGDEMIEEMKKQHAAKMERFDKLLDLLGKRD